MNILLGLSLLVMITTALLSWVFVLILIIKFIRDKYLTMK